MSDSSKHLISVIMPVYNSERYLRQAIDSVINQSYLNWELLIIDDGSYDRSKEIYECFEDNRIRIFKQNNKGVSAARNVGLKEMQGEFFCFLDSDDVLPAKSLQLRIEKFVSNLNLDFVDGAVEIFDTFLSIRKKKYQPNYNGNPFNQLTKLSERCFFGPSWMVRKREATKYRMNESVTHGEDLLFYMEISRNGGQYDFINETVLYYRSHRASAMKNIVGLLDGYRKIYHIIRGWPEVSIKNKIIYQLRIRKIMCLEYLSKGQIKQALSALLS